MQYLHGKLMQYIEASNHFDFDCVCLFKLCKFHGVPPMVYLNEIYTLWKQHTISKSEAFGITCASPWSYLVFDDLHALHPGTHYSI